MRLCVGIPVVGFVAAEVYHSHLASMVPIAREFETIIPVCINLYPHAAARNHIMDEAIKCECDYLYFLDSDMLPDPMSPLALLEVLKSTPDAVMTTGHAYRRGYPHTSVWTKVHQNRAMQVTAPSTTPPFEIESAGSACNMIDVKWVRDNLTKPWFVQGQVIHEGRPVEVNEDSWFCQRIREKGGKIIAVPQVRPGHLHAGIVINDNNADYLRSEFLRTAGDQIERFDTGNVPVSDQRK